MWHEQLLLLWNIRFSYNWFIHFSYWKDLVYKILEIIWHEMGPHGVRGCVSKMPRALNTLRQRQNGRYFADDIFKCIFLNENVWISLKMSLKFVPMVWISNIPALVQIMAWHRPGNKPLSESMMISLQTHICVTRPQWVKLSTLYKIISFNVWVEYHCAELQKYPLRLLTTISCPYIER